MKDWGHVTANKAAYDRHWELAMDDLPDDAGVVAGTQEEVNAFVRCVVNNCRVDSIPNRTIDVFFKGQRYLLKGKVTIDLQLPLADMAAGRCYPAEHGNANTAFSNVQQILPTRVGGKRVTYLEYGWRLRVPRLLMKVSYPGDPSKAAIDYVELTNEDGSDAPFGVKSAMGRRIVNDGGTVETGLRLVISDWGHLFFTDSHYRSFLIYDAQNDKWEDYGTRRDADVSWYTKGAQNIGWVLPACARGYY